MKKILVYVTMAFGALFSSCEKYYDTLNSNTDDTLKRNNNKTIIVDNSLFINAANDDFEFVNAEINGDSLKLTIRYGGGCGDIEIKLIDSEDIMESIPPQRNIRLSLKDHDSCEALLSKVISFNLTPVRISENHKVLLNLSGWSSPLLYEY